MTSDGEQGNVNKTYQVLGLLLRHAGLLTDMLYSNPIIYFRILAITFQYLPVFMLHALGLSTP